METTTPWTLDKPTRSPFAMPSGLPGRLAGRLMLWTNRQQDLLDLLAVQRESGSWKSVTGLAG